MTHKKIAMSESPPQATAALRCQMTVAKEWLLLAVVIGLLGISGLAGAVTVTASPATCVSTSAGSAWSNPTRAAASDNSYATASVDGTITQYLQCTGYGFAIPGGATINGITVNVERKSSSVADGGSADNAMRLVKTGVIGATDRSTTTTYTTLDVVEAHGSLSDLWGTTWTSADINAANFGAAFKATKASPFNAAHTISVDQIQISVDYSFPCNAPSNTPAGLALTCVCDTFGRSTLNPSTIFGANWSVSNSDGISNPDINAVTGLLRLTENTGYNAKSATVPGIFPAAGNYISVEFNHYAYKGSGADGIAVTLSDYSVPAVPGGFGGSLGYAQRNDGVLPPGFAGGWIGVALDEFGNYQNPTEGRVLGSGFVTQSVGVRGPGKGANGYRWLGGTGSNPGGLSIDNAGSTTPAPSYMYQVIVDARTAGTGTINVGVNRDAVNKDGTSYTSMFGPFNAYGEANFALSQGWISKVVPDYWKISFTGSTGGSTNIHEIGGLRICAQTVYPPAGGTASGFSTIDEGYPVVPGTAIPAYPNFQTGDIFMKLAGTPFKLWVAALTASAISGGYSAVSDKYVAVKLVDNTDNACGTDSGRTCTSACTNKAAVEAGGLQIIHYTSSDLGAALSPSFTLNSSWNNLLAVVKECTSSSCAGFTATAPACSADSFSVRPTSIASVTSSNATNAGTAGPPPPVFKAGSDNFSLTATTTGIAGNASRYTGILKIDSTAIQAIAPATIPGAVAGAFQAAVSGTPASTANGIVFTYSEVGGFGLRGYDPASDTTSPRGVYDGVAMATECPSPTTPTQCDLVRKLTWTYIDSVSNKNDCINDSYSNVKDTSGKYGCNFGIIANTATIGRFIPDHFGLTAQPVTDRNDLSCNPASSFTYMGEPIKLQFTLTAQNAASVTTKNYTGAVGAGSLAKLDLNVPANFVLGALDSYSSSVTRNITQITKANPGVITTSVAHGYTTGDTVYISGVLGMIAINNKYGPVTVVDATHFSINNLDTSTFATYTSGTSGGTALKKATSGTDLGTARLALTSSAGTWTNGVSMNGLSSLIPLIFRFNRLASVDGSYISEFGIAPVDTDGVKLLAYNMDISAPVGNDHSSVGLTSMRYGRIRLTNAYGSELLPLLVPFTAQYFQSGIGWVANADDTCTQVAVPTTGGAGLTFYAQTTKNQLAAGEAIARMRNAADSADVTAVGLGTLHNGLANLRLTGPLGATVGPGGGNFGFMDVTPDFSTQSWLQFNWAGSAVPINPTARATFGTYKSPVIYLRENY